MDDEETPKHPKYDYDTLIAESDGLFREWWILWKRIHPEWGLIPEKKPVVLPAPKPKPTFKPLGSSQNLGNTACLL